MKKFQMAIIAVLALLMFVIPVSAANQQDEVEARAKEAERYAYMDLESASPELREKILDARNAIIYSTDWVADGYSMTVCRSGVEEELPQFSELFPDWDIPKDNNLPPRSELVEVRDEGVVLVPKATWRNFGTYSCYDAYVIGSGLG